MSKPDFIRDCCLMSNVLTAKLRHADDDSVLGSIHESDAEISVALKRVRTARSLASGKKKASKARSVATSIKRSAGKPNKEPIDTEQLQKLETMLDSLYEFAGKPSPAKRRPVRCPVLLALQCQIAHAQG
jgi:hypothetical protein